MKQLQFTKSQRLKTNEQFRDVMSRRCCVSKGLIRLYTAGNSCGYPRFGVSIGKSWGNAVVRNRLKRLSREVFRIEQHNIAPNLDYLLIFSPKMSKNTIKTGSASGNMPDFNELRSLFLDLAGQAVSRFQKRQ